MSFARQGRGWLFGDHIGPDDALTGKEPLNVLLGLTRPDQRDFSQYCMIGYDPEFPRRARPGDFVVAGTNFGVGRVHQPFWWSLTAFGVGGIIAESFIPRFPITAANFGVLCLECPGIRGLVSPGDELAADFRTGKVVNRTTGRELQGKGMPDTLITIAELGREGYLQKRVADAQGGQVPVRGIVGGPPARPRPRSATEKVLARGAGVPAVERGQTILFEPDLYICHDHYVYPEGAEAMQKHGVTRVWNPDKVMVVYDHDSTPHLWAAQQAGGRKWVQQQGIQKFFDVGWGLSHQVPADVGYIRPGMLVANHDPRLVSFAAQGACAVALPMAPWLVHLEMILTGSLWLTVPEPVKFVINGRLNRGVTPRDLFIHLNQQVGNEALFGKTVEFAGPVITAMDIDQRMTLMNQLPSPGAINGWIEPDEKTLAYVNARTRDPYEVVRNDPDLEYGAVWEVDVTDLQPLVSPPPDPVLNAGPVGDFRDVPVHAGFIGSCLGGRLDELRLAAKVLAGRKLAPYTRLMVTPISKSVLRQAQAEGLLDVFLDAGAIVDVPGCGACWGGKFVLTAGENCIANMNTNIKGRMGSAEAQVFLANAAVIAASCVEGRVTDPRPYLE